MTESRFKRVRVVNDPFQQMIDEAIEQLDPEERRIIEKIRSMPDLDLQFKDFESDPVQNLRDLVKVWREIHPEDFEEEQKETTSSTASSANELQIVLNRIEELKQLLGEIKDRLSGISRLERYLALIAGVGLDELLLLRRLREHPELIERFMEQLKKLESRNEKN
ncbi:MAG: hypothetical protein HSCHL_0963 [Hydrogenibacillus schlegelii]|uniref:Uncharacterized protein n=2 Tax=Hydrogenibacillus schlegelii TaxID=1484 RepID=A0A2T5G3E4_HYDSH|nr:MAG: hypothetical protein HSCHL_0963 [Hydrogenibacillus schlegelii]